MTHNNMIQGTPKQIQSFEAFAFQEFQQIKVELEKSLCLYELHEITESIYAVSFEDFFKNKDAWNTDAFCLEPGKKEILVFCGVREFDKIFNGYGNWSMTSANFKFFHNTKGFICIPYVYNFNFLKPVKQG